MPLFKHSRYYYRLAREVSQKYKFALVFGFLLGLAGSIGFIHIYPLWIAPMILPVQRIAIVGDFTPSSLPQSIQEQISTGLTAIGDDGAALPGIAKSWEATDSGKTYIFHLSSGIRWHNGKALDSRDVNYNIRDVTFTQTDPLTLKASLKENYSPFPTLVSKPIFLPGLIGVGQYKVSAIRLKGDRVQLIKLIPAASLKNSVREYRFYPSETQAITAYKRGDVDIIEDITNPADLVRWGKTTLAQHTNFNRVMALFINMKDPILKEKNIRQALAYGTPDLPAPPALSPINSKSWAYTDSVRRFSHDDAQVHKLLKSTSASTASADLTISTFSTNVELAQKIASGWNALGIKSKVKVINDVSEGFQILLSPQLLPPDPDQYPFWHSTQVNTNITGYANVKIDKLLEDGRRELDQEKRKKIYADFARRLVDDAPAIFLSYQVTYRISRTHTFWR